MTTNIIDRGDKIRLGATFTDVLGVVKDPTVITLQMKTPDGVLASLAPVSKTSTGIYYYDFTAAQAGDHHYRFTGTGDVVAAGEGFFQVRKSAVIA